MIHPHTELRYVSSTVGHGVFATAFIPKGTFLWVLDPFDRILTVDEVRALPPALKQAVERWAYVDPTGHFVFCWDHGRYMNHSCRPTSRGIGDAFEIAVRDVLPGEELTCEYGILNIGKTFDCACGQEGCRGRVGPGDVERLFPMWDAEAEDAFQHAARVAQPLLPFAKAGPRDHAVLDALARGATSAALPSHRDYRRDGAEADADSGEGEGLWAIAGVHEQRRSRTNPASSRRTSTRRAGVAR